MRVIYREPLTRVDFNFLLLRRGCAQSDEIIEAGNLFFNFHYSGLIITEIYIYIYIENRIACHWRDLFENSWTVSKKGDAERSVVSWAVRQPSNRKSSSHACRQRQQTADATDGLREEERDSAI